MRYLSILLLALFGMNCAVAKTDLHAHHKMSKMKSSPEKTNMLSLYPSSGQARELGYDDSIFMVSTTINNSLAAKCAQASRGLVMLDRATWQQCQGNRPEGGSVNLRIKL